MKVGNDGATFSPLLFGFEVDNAVWDGKIFSKAPFVSRTNGGLLEWWPRGGRGCKVW